MDNIKEIRAKRPEWANLSDDSVVNVVRQAYYPEMTNEQLASEIGAQATKAPEKSRTWGQAAGDTGRAIASGVGGLVKSGGTLYGLATGDMDNDATELGESVQKYWEDGQSDQLKAKKAARAQNIEDADGVLGKAGTALWDTISDPALAVDTVASNIATLIPGAAVGRIAAGANAARGMAAASKFGPASVAAREAVGKAAGTMGTRAAIGTGALQQGADVSGDVYEAAMKKPDAVWANNPEFMNAFGATDGGEQAWQDTKKAFALSTARATMPAATAISLGANMLPGADMLERALVGGAAKDTLKAGTKYATAKAIGKGALGEMGQEGIEEGGGAFAGNVAKQQLIDDRQYLGENVGENAGMGMAGGLLMGGAAGAFHGTGRPAINPAIAAAEQAALAKANAVTAAHAAAQTPNSPLSRAAAAANPLPTAPALTAEQIEAEIARLEAEPEVEQDPAQPQAQPLARQAPAAQASSDFASILDTEAVYSGWSNTRDGTDRAIMRDQMAYVGRTYGGAVTEENRQELDKDLSTQFKWFRAATPAQKTLAIDALILQSSPPGNAPPATAAPTAAVTTIAPTAPVDADPMYAPAVEFVLATGKPSIARVHRHLNISYNRAARLVEDMERAGLVSTMAGDGSRTLLKSAADTMTGIPPVNDQVSPNIGDTPATTPAAAQATEQDARDYYDEGDALIEEGRHDEGQQMKARGDAILAALESNPAPIAGLLDGDKLNQAGKPFNSEGAAKVMLRKYPGHELTKLDSGWVIRPQVAAPALPAPTKEVPAYAQPDNTAALAAPDASPALDASQPVPGAVDGRATPPPPAPESTQTGPDQTRTVARTDAAGPAATGTSAGIGTVEADGVAPLSLSNESPAQEAPAQSAIDSVAPAASASIAGPAIDKDWSAFTPESGTLSVPRAEMPQIEAGHRGAMVNFLKARGIESQQDEVPADSLKPTQSEFSPEKVSKAQGFSGPDRSILVSSDGYVLDGHHQMLAKREAGALVKVIRLDAPIDALLSAVREFPSATLDEGASAPADASRYQLPEGDIHGDWKRYQSPDFKPTPRQQIIMDAVGQAKDEGLFYADGIKARAVELLQVSPEVLALNKSNTDGGDVGYDLYYARNAVDAHRGNQKSRDISDAMDLKAGDVIGTLITSDYKQTTGVTIVSVGDDGLSVKFIGKRGAYSVSGEIGVDSIKASIDRAKEKGKRKDGYAEFVAARNAQPTPTATENVASTPAADQPSPSKNAATPPDRPDGWEKKYDLARPIAEALGIDLNDANGVRKQRPALVAEINERDRSNYFTPGNVVKSYGGHDEVLSYAPPKTGSEGWSVRVRAVVQQDGQWVPSSDERERSHSTQPDVRELKAGPLAQAEGTSRQTHIDSTLKQGGKVVDGTLRTSSGMSLYALSADELASVPTEKQDTSAAIKARMQAVYGEKEGAPAAPAPGNATDPEVTALLRRLSSLESLKECLRK